MIPHCLSFAFQFENRRGSKLCLNSRQEDSIDASPTSARIPLGTLASLTSDVVSAGEARIIAACWASFVMPRRSFEERGPMWNAVSVLDEPAGNRCTGVCLLTSENCLLFYTTAGEKFEARVPFQVWNLWPARSGLLLERQLTDEEKGNRFRLPCIFFLGHPLDEPSPVVLFLPPQLILQAGSHVGAVHTPPTAKEAGIALHVTTNEGARVQFANEAHQRIVFVSNEEGDSSLVLTYDHHNRQHCLWRLRAAVESVSFRRRLCRITAPCYSLLLASRRTTDGIIVGQLGFGSVGEKVSKFES